MSIEKAEFQELPQIKDRISFIYLERCVITRADGAVAAMDERGEVHIPSAQLTVLMLGPGTRVTHRAMELVADSGMTIVWVGERGVRYYASGNPLTHSARLLIRQAELVSNVQKRAAVCRKMYALRFPDENMAELSIQQMRGKEGTRVSRLYYRLARETGVQWNGRQYDPDNFEGSDAINKTLSAAHACLYGVCHSVIVALGCSPGLGFIHTGHEKSFVYDIADLYKADITIPLAFKVAAEYGDSEDIAAETRRRVRDAISDGRILERCVKDIHNLLFIENDETVSADVLHLWDRRGETASGRNYGDAVTEQDIEGESNAVLLPE